MINSRYTPPTREVKRFLHESYIAQGRRGMYSHSACFCAYAVLFCMLLASCHAEPLEIIIGGKVHRPERVNQCTCPHGPQCQGLPSGTHAMPYHSALWTESLSDTNPSEHPLYQNSLLYQNTLLHQNTKSSSCSSASSSCSFNAFCSSASGLYSLSVVP